MILYILYLVSRQPSWATHNQVAAQNINEATVHTWANLVEFGDKGMLQPVYQRLAPEYQKAGRKKSGHCRHGWKKRNKWLRIYWKRGWRCRWQFDKISNRDDGHKHRELEPFHDVYHVIRAKRILQMNTYVDHSQHTFLSPPSHHDLPLQLNWKRFSFSNFLKTLPLISTNWLLMRRVRRAFEYEFTATFKVTIWKNNTRVWATMTSGLKEEEC